MGGLRRLEGLKDSIGSLRGIVFIAKAHNWLIFSFCSKNQPNQCFFVLMRSGINQLTPPILLIQNGRQRSEDGGKESKASNDKITYKQTKRLQLPEGITFAPVIHETSSLFRHHFKLKGRCKKMKIGLEELLTNDAAIYLHTASTTVD